MSAQRASGRAARCDASGRSLVELLIVLVLLGMVLATAAPALHGVLQRQQLQVAVNDLMAAIRLTRSQAQARGAKVLLVPQEASGSSWRQGWVVFIDQNGNQRPDASETIFLRRGPVSAGLAIRAAFSSAAIPAYLAYNSAGRPCGAENSLTARWGTVTLQQGGNVRNIKINLLGRLRVCDPAREGASCTSAID